MDTKQIEYILKIAEENNITRAAEKLFITQPALNQQLLKLERELGTQLFYRSRTDWRPTEAGMVYLENAKKMLLIKQDTYRIINDMTAQKQGSLSVGLTPGRGIAMFSAVYPRFHQEYPEITVTPHELSVKKQQPLIARGELDIGFQTLCGQSRTADEYIPIASEEIRLVIPAGHPLAVYAVPEHEPFALMDISRLRYEPFVLMYKESTIRPLIDHIFLQAGFEPQVLFETSSNAAILTMIRSNLCCGLIPDFYIRDSREGIACFSLPGSPSWDIAASYRKGSYLSRGARRFIEMAAEFFRRENSTESLF